TGRPDELLARELVQALAHSALVEAAHRGDRAGPEDLPHHRRILEKRLALRGQGVEAGGDQSVHGFRYRPVPITAEELRGRPHARELFGVERVAAASLK